MGECSLGQWIVGVVSFQKRKDMVCIVKNVIKCRNGQVGWSVDSG